MSTDRYNSPLSERYASKEMQYIFSPDMKFRTSTMMWQRQEKKKSVMMLCPMYMLTAYSVRKQKESSI